MTAQTVATEIEPESSYTGLRRSDWEAAADRLLQGVLPFASASYARIALPGPVSVWGQDSDALEGFARTFLLAAVRIAGANGEPAVVGDLLDRYAAGLAAGADPRHPDAWPRIDRDEWQPMVEAASIVVGLHLTRPWLWEQLDPRAQEHVVGWLSGMLRYKVSPNNWLWFDAVVQEFLASVGGPHRPEQIERDVQASRQWELDTGWYTDGAGRRIDHYNGWALHLYPLLWSDMAAHGSRADVAGELRRHHRTRLHSFLADYIHLIGGDGAPLHQGRSLIYRTATATALWTGALYDCNPLPPGLTRRAASGILRYFADRGAPDEQNLLSLGWLQSFRGMVQVYSGPASPYWASKGFLGLLLPADHPVWTAAEEPLPAEEQDCVRALVGPNWLVQATADDGIVRVHNHGSDGVVRGEVTDDPHYARACFTTATAPRVVFGSPAVSADNRVTILDPCGRALPRGRIHPIAVRADGRSGHAASWDSPEPGVRVESHVIAHGRYELRLHLVHAPRGWTVRESGHNLSGAGQIVACSGRYWTAATNASGRWTAMSPLAGYENAGLDTASDVDAFGGASVVPYLCAEHAGGRRVYASCVVLSGAEVDEDAPPPARLTISGESVVVAFPPGVRREWKFVHDDAAGHLVAVQE